MPPDEDQLSLRQADQIRGDLYGLQDDLDFIKVQLAQLPTRNEVWRAAMLGMLGGAVAAVTLIEALWPDHLGGVRFDLVVTRLTPQDDSDASRSRVAERHRWPGR
jgi:hypothetical protein